MPNIPNNQNFIKSKRNEKVMLNIYFIQDDDIETSKATKRTDKYIIYR